MNAPLKGVQMKSPRQPITNRILSGNRGNSNIALPERRGSPMMI